ncbi:MAG: anti-sigma factor family protein [Actinomycetota bacterium]
MISCTDAVKQLWDYLDGAVTEADRHAIQEHLDVCKRCCGEVEFADELRKFLSHQASDDLPPEAKERLTAFLEEI